MVKRKNTKSPLRQYEEQLPEARRRVEKLKKLTQHIRILATEYKIYYTQNYQYKDQSFEFRDIMVKSHKKSSTKLNTNR